MKKTSLILVVVILCVVLAGAIGFGAYKYATYEEPQEIPEETLIYTSEPKEVPAVLNFGDYYEIVYDETSSLQEKVDAGLLVGAYGDYYHHNTNDFLELFWMLDKVQEIVIDGNSYSFVGYTTAVLQTETDNSIKMEDGTIVENNNRTEIITCQAEESNPNRFVAILERK